MNKALPQEIYYVGSYWERSDGEREPMLIGKRSGGPYTRRQDAERILREQRKRFKRTDAKILVGSVAWSESEED